jgi:hypothetical protein
VLDEALAIMTGLRLDYEQGRICAHLAQAAGQLGDHHREQQVQAQARAAYVWASAVASSTGTRASG